jgi:hypothetical protein
VSNVNTVVRLYGQLNRLNKHHAIAYLESLLAAQESAQNHGDGQAFNEGTKTVQSGIRSGFRGPRCPVCNTRLQGTYCHNCGWTRTGRPY